MDNIIDNMKKMLEYLTGYNVLYKYETKIERICYSSNLPSLLGYTREEYAQFPPAQILSNVFPPDKELIKDKMLEQIGVKNDLDLSFRMVRKDGSLIWVRDHIKYLGKVDNASIYLASFYNVTDEWKNRDALLEASERAITAIDKYNKNVLYANTKFLEMAKAEANDCLGKPCYDVLCRVGHWPGKDCVCFKACLQEAGMEYYNQKADKYFAIMARETMWGEHEAIVFYISDITADKKRDMELEVKNQELQRMQSEVIRNYRRQLDAIMEMSPDALSTFQINITRNICSNGVSKYPGLMDLQADGTVDSYFKVARKYMRAEEYDSKVDMFSRKNLLEAFSKGKTTVMAETYFMVDKADERIIRTIVHMTENPLTHDVEGVLYTVDITRTILNKAIMEHAFNKKYEGASIIDLKLSTYILLQFNYNKEVEKNRGMMDYDAGLHRLVANFVVPEDQNFYLRSASLANIKRKVNEKGIYSFLCHYKIGNLIRHKRINYYLVDKERQLVLALSEDITDITKQEQKRVAELQGALAEAEEAREAKSMFFSNISHDMRTPLNGVLGFTTLGKEAETLQEKDECLQKIETSGRFLLHLINDTLDISKMESKRMELVTGSFSPKKLVDDIITAVEQTAKDKNLELVEKVPAHVDYFVQGDRMRLQQIFINLLGNAIKFTPEGGRVEIQVELLEKPVLGANHRISVIDNGIGMKKEFLPHAFDAFSQEKDVAVQNAMGTGLGLAIVKQLVDLMHGHIEAESEEGRGTKFDIYLPLPIVKNCEEEHSNSTVRTSLAGKHVLLCEDHVINKELMLRLLEKKKVSADWAADGKIGLEMFQKSEPHYYDGILMDLRMPNMDGLEATRAIRSLQREDAKAMPIIALTANAFNEDRQQAEEAGMDAYVVKPIVPATLYETLGEYLK